MRSSSTLVSLFSITVNDSDRQDIIYHEHVDNDGAMFVPIVLGSDKMTVSVTTGQHNYYPLYLSIGNLHNSARRSHRHGVALIAFLAIPKSKCHDFVS